jgi:fucose permease
MTRFIRVPMIGAFALLLFFQSGNEFLLGGYISAYLTRELRVPVAEASYWLAGYWASLMLARLILSRVVLKGGAPAVVTGGAVLAAAGALAIGSARTAGPAVASVFLTGFALAGIFPGVLGITGARFREHSGTVFGILFTVALCGGMTIPWLAGHLAEAAGMGWVFVLAAANFAVVAMLSLAARRPAA